VNGAYPPGSPRKLLATTALLCLSLGLAAMLTQCKMVTDELGGTKVSQNVDASTCISACAHAYNDSIRVESALHVSNVHACAGDLACLASEDARHDAAVDRIQRGRQDCQNRCHHQGGGSGGR
jgi:hypothetical protein